MTGDVHERSKLFRLTQYSHGVPLVAVVKFPLKVLEIIPHSEQAKFVDRFSLVVRNPR